MIVTILAAGLSRRFGSFKPLSPFAGKMLIEYALDALPIDYPQYLVVGHNKELLQDALKDRNVEFIFNPDYEKGILFSVLTALKRARDEQRDLLITLGDLPFVTEENYKGLIKAFKGRPIFSSFDGQIGPPAIIPLDSIKNYLTEVGQDPDGLVPLKKHFKDCDLYPLAAAAKDIDSISDWS